MDQMNRRGFLGAILAAAVAPAIVRSTSIMPLWLPRDPATWVDAEAGQWEALKDWPNATGQEIYKDIAQLFVAQVTGTYDVTVTDSQTGLSAVRRTTLMAGDTVQPTYPARESLTDVRLTHWDDQREIARNHKVDAWHRRT
jgi:hypothetical protein